MAKGRPKKINWGAVKSAYVGERGLSLKRVAERFKISYSSVKKISTTEGWVADKEKRWKEQEEEALKEVEGSIKDLIIRHAKVARFLQAGSLKHLQVIVKDLDKNPKKVIRSSTNPKFILALIKMTSEGLKAERELYPKQMQVEGDVKLQIEEASEELKKAANEALKKQLTKRRRSSKRSSRS